jgi:multidrug efflux pump subunit AcrA (membrane-fusion protein)
MPPELSAASIHPADVTLQALDDLLDQAGRLARSDLEADEFHMEFLGSAVRALAAVGGAIWIRSAPRSWRAEARVDLSGGRTLDALAHHLPHAELLDAVAAADQSRLVLPRSAAADESPLNPTELLLLAAPVSLGESSDAQGVLEIIQRPGSSPASQQGYLRLLEALCELAADFHRRRRLRGLEELAARVERAEQFNLAVHRSLELVPTAMAIVNEGRGLIGCDRLSVAVRRRGAFRLVAVSGLETFDRRSDIVRRLEELTHAVLAAGDPLWFAGEVSAQPPQIAVPLHAWQDESHARSVAVIPLSGPSPREPADRAPRPIAALIAERFTGETNDQSYRERVLAVSRQAGLALQNSLEYQGVPLLKPLRALQYAAWFIAIRHLPRALAALALVLAAAAALWLIPAELKIEGRGVLEPRKRRDVFARSDGIVSEVLVEHGQDCREGEPLVLMTRSQLDFEWSRVLGELATARKRLATVQASRLDLSPQTAADREKYNQLTAEEEEVQELLKGLEQQHEVLKAQREELVVKSPLTGQVVTWNVRQTLEARPVQRGQVLLQVADLAGPWVLEVEVPDERIGHVLRAQGALRPDLDVWFMLATEPGALYHGSIEKVALSTDVRPPEKANVTVTVKIDQARLPRLRPGATVVSQIGCGRRSLGFVWFHRAWEIFLKKVMF